MLLVQLLAAGPFFLMSLQLPWSAPGGLPSQGGATKTTIPPKREWATGSCRHAGHQSGGRPASSVVLLRLLQHPQHLHSRLQPGGLLPMLLLRRGLLLPQHGLLLLQQIGLMLLIGLPPMLLLLLPHDLMLLQHP